MTETERRSLLARLDQTSDGWRRLALAFLEAQAWRDSFAALEPRPSERLMSDTPPAVRGWQLGWPGTCLAMAASFMVAFSLALLVRGEWSRPSDTTQMAQTHPLVQRDEQVQPAGMPTASPEHGDLVPLAMHDEPETEEPETDLSAELDLANDEIPLVIADWSDDDGPWSVDESLIPQHIVQALERAGHRLLRRPELLPIELSDGTRGLIPIERVELQYVGSQFQ